MGSQRIGSIRNRGVCEDKDSKAFGWLRQFIEWQKDLPDNRQFMDSVKLELFHDVVYVFTPKGTVKELPKGATPVDFAYAIHTEVGDHCVGAKVNGKIVPLKHEVTSGDTIEILTSLQPDSAQGLAQVRTHVTGEDQDQTLDQGGGTEAEPGNRLAFARSRDSSPWVGPFAGLKVGCAARGRQTGRLCHD